MDANTYTISSTTPLRLKEEVASLGGDTCGSSFLNEEFSKLLHSRLDSETYLNERNNTISGYIEKIMINEFEYKIKRSFNYISAKGFKVFEIPGLRANADKLFKDGEIHIPVKLIREIFIKRCLEPIKLLMQEQITQAMERNARVEKVILIGGFAASVSLQIYLERGLSKFCTQNNLHQIELIKPDKSKSDYNAATAVASGAVLRAFNKEQGPRREARCSYGILRSEPWVYDKHKGQPKTYSPHDGVKYLKNSIYWFLKLGTTLEPTWDKTMEFVHLFDYAYKGPLMCEELLYVSDSATESHYQRNHPKNAGAIKVGSIMVDFTDLRDRGLIQPIDPEFDENGQQHGRRHYKIAYEIEIIVVDRDLRCRAIYDGQTRKECHINIASAFTPGVK